MFNRVKQSDLLSKPFPNLHICSINHRIYFAVRTELLTMPNFLNRSSAEGHSIVFARFCSSNTRTDLRFNLTAVKDDLNTVKNREGIAKKMTQQQIAEAQKLAKECQARNFKNCD